jgi:ABC-type nitrate/sulfonate/bicarbonate transport system permease component
MTMAMWYRKYEALVLGAIGILVVIALWQAASDLGMINPLFLSSPAGIFREAVRQIAEGVLWSDVGTTVLEIAIAFSAASAMGILAGLMMGMFSRVEFITEPFVWFLYSTPLIAFYPLFVVYLGLGFNTVVMMGFVMAVIPITINTLAGVKSTNPILIRAAHSFGATNRQIIFKIALPSALPFIVTGLKLGVERTLIGVIVGEMFSSNAGLGFRISLYGARLQTASLFVPLVVVVLLGLLATQLLRLWEHRYVDRTR